MNREIKFRIWNGVRMDYDVMAGRFGTFYVNPMKKGDGLDEKDSASLTPFNTICDKETPVMQYTGLKDKNGKEIYEGDICLYKGDSPMVVTWIGGIGLCSSTYALTIPNTHFRVDFQYVDWFSTSVVNNIYESPELLK